MSTANVRGSSTPFAAALRSVQLLDERGHERNQTVGALGELRLVRLGILLARDLCGDKVRVLLYIYS